MAKQIMISQNDYGIIFNIQLLDEDKKPLVIADDTIRFYVVKPTNEKIEVSDIDVIDELLGKVEFELSQEHTDTVGNHGVYVEISSPTYEITSVLAENYYVMPEHGGN